jgi:hypothetical protein
MQGRGSRLESEISRMAVPSKAEQIVRETQSDQNGVAQAVEWLLCKPEALSSNPILPPQHISTQKDK